MSFYDDASLAFLASGGAGKDGKAYSIKPTDGSGDFTFSRGSNLTATRVDSNGLIEKGRENLLSYSNEFATSPWGVNGLETPTTGESGYDGSTDAWLLETSASSGRLTRTTSLSGVNTFSFYAKKGNVNYIAFFGISSGSFPRAWFNLETGNVSNQLNHIDAKMEIIGNGWYRCSITFDEAVTELRIYPTNTAGSFSAGAGETSIIQDAQLEQGLVATEYIESGATTGKAGILEHSPRFDYSGGASCPSLLLEPSRTNEFSFSEYASGNTLTGSPIITENYAVSPDGMSNAFRIQDTTGGTFKRIAESFSVSANSTYTQSIFVKKATSAVSIYGGIGFDYSGGTREISYIIFDEYNGTMTAIQSQSTLTLHDAEDYGDYWRFSITATDTGSNNYLSLNIYACLSTNGTSPTAGVKDWIGYGLQLEEGSYPTSYIPNHSGGTATRNTDECTKTGVSGLIGQTEGTIYCEFEYNGAADSGVFNRIIALGTGVTQNRILLAKNDTTAELLAFAVSGGTTQVSQAISGTSIIGHHKVAISYKANEYKVYLDGQLKFTDTSASVPATTNVYIGTAEDGTTNNELGGVVKESIIYKEVLSEDDCKALTTL